MNILVTGASGFVGRALIPKLINKGNKVYGLSRHPPPGNESLIPLEGDITETNLGLPESLLKDVKISAVHHLAGIHRLDELRAVDIWRTNVEGTRNVLKFCLKNKVGHLYFCSTAFTLGRNTYEKSKVLNEKEVKEFCSEHHIRLTIFKPSIIMGTAEHPYPGHFSQFIALVIKIHQRAELIRRRLEGNLRLPIIEPVFRIKGNAQGTLNMITVDDVARAMVCTRRPGIHWLTNPKPPTLAQLVKWTGEFIMVNISIQEEFKATPIEASFQKRAQAFKPYLKGDNFPSDMAIVQPINRQFIQGTIKGLLSGQPREG